ncbi:unnamed protein product, partial [Anisakis simplex]|uniref:AMP-binding domain-containing protein n=1 Tax=Anisakis simplex TaxID=6269 RepID=A0A0M3JNH2_ANISI
MTEVSLASHLPDIEDGQNFGNCGKIAPTFKQKIIDVQSKKECGVGEKGEILIQGPTVMRGYLNRDEATAETID